MHALSALFALTALFSSVVASPVTQAPTIIPEQPSYPPTDQVYIKGVKYAGSGCKAGSVNWALASDGSNVNVIFDSFQASVGDGILITDNRKNCQLIFELQYPQGWALTIFDTSYFGYVKLDKGVTASQQSTYRFSTQPSQQQTFYSTWVGKIDEDYSFTDTLIRDSLVWSPCTNGAPSNLIVNTEVKTDNSKNKRGSGTITTDSIEHVVTHVYGFQWKKC